MTANIWMDFLQERMPNIRESRATAINKLIGVYGFVNMCIKYHVKSQINHVDQNSV